MDASTFELPGAIVHPFDIHHVLVSTGLLDLSLSFFLTLICRTYDLQCSLHLSFDA